LHKLICSVSFAEEEFHKAFDDLLGIPNLTEPFFLVVQVQTCKFHRILVHSFSSYINHLNCLILFTVGISSRFLWSNMGTEEFK
jgi:hypothetical protein